MYPIQEKCGCRGVWYSYDYPPERPDMVYCLFHRWYYWLFPYKNKFRVKK